MANIERINHGIWKCRRCANCAFRTPPVPESFPQKAKVLIVGQNPGQGNDTMELTFNLSFAKFTKWHVADYAGSTACKEIAILFDDDEWYKKYAKTNVVKCRTSSNSAPSEEMFLNCQKWLTVQLDSMKPKLIITIGSPALRYFTERRLGQQAGKAIRTKGGYVIFPVFHYAFLRRNGQSYNIYTARLRSLMKQLEVQ